MLPQASPLGGAERAVLDLLDSPLLQQLDQRVAFVSGTPNDAFPPRLVLSLPGTVRARPPIVHGWLLRGNLGAAAIKLVRPSTVLVTSERNLGHALTPAKRMLERAVAALEQVATANSTAVRDAATARLARRETAFRVIPTGVAAPARPAAVERFTCVMVGRLHPVKDHATALKAWSDVVKEHPDATLAIVGEGPERPRVEELLHQLGLNGRVHLVGERDPAPFLYGAELFLSSSRSEGLSRAILEAMAVGLPVVATDVGGHRELASAAVRRVPAGDPRGLALAVGELLAEPDERAAAARAASETARGFSLEASHEAYRALYEELGVPRRGG